MYGSKISTYSPKSFTEKKKLIGKYSAFTIAGAAVGVTHNKFKKWHKTFYDNLGTSIQLHKIEKLIVINHKDSFSKIKKQIKKRFPKLKVELNLISLDSKIIKF